MLARILALVLAVPLLLVGGFGLAAAYAPDLSLLDDVRGRLETAAAEAEDGPLSLPDAASRAEELVAGPALRFVLAPMGFALLVFAFLPGGRTEDAEDEEEGAAPTGAKAVVDKRLVKKTEKTAIAMARKGSHLEAAELLCTIDEYEKAADYFIKAGEYSRAAEIRHDQNRFLEAAELHLKAEEFSSAGLIFGQQGEFAKAADCYLKADSKSVAAEMFEKAEDYKQAGDCYREVEFLRHAAQMYVKCNRWLDAATCLDEVFTEEGGKAQSDPKKAAELTKLVLQAGKLYQKAEQLEKAGDILDRGGCAKESAQIAVYLGQFARASELFLAAGEPRKAADALESLGEHDEAARVLGEYQRDQGELEEAARHFEAAKEWNEAGDIYRRLEIYDKAGPCYASQGEYANAAEMFRLAGDRPRAAECYERAQRFQEAAECYALAGMAEPEAKALEQAGEFLKAGEVFHREGMDEEAIRVLQQVDAANEGFAIASALLGDIFRSRGKLSLAIKKLQQAIGAAELDRSNLPVYFTLATIHQDHDEFREAAEIFEKVMALDYHYQDVEQRLVTCRDSIGTEAPVAAAGTGGGAGQGQTPPSGQPGRYQIVGELGRGGMGIVYKANDTVLDRIVAFKVLPEQFMENQQAVANFIREAKSAAKLSHPNIVTVYDTGEQDGHYYIAMEHVDGTTLKDILQRRGVISPAGVYHVLVQVCEALAYAHEHKVVHRDIKSANTMWTRDKKAKIMDFGLAKVVEEVRNHTTVVSGTPYYMSPEQTLGKNVDHRTDIYSLGVMTFEMATGTLPFKEGNIPYHHVHTPPPDIREVKAELPAPLAAIVARCLAKDPGDRYQSAGDILVDVRALLADASASRPASES